MLSRASQRGSVAGRHSLASRVAEREGRRSDTKVFGGSLAGKVTGRSEFR